MKTRGIWIVLVLLIAALAGCGGGQSTTEPPEILYGQDVCDACNMIISEENHAAAYWTADGQARRFDDVGEMLTFMAGNPEEIASTWVHDVNTAVWLPAEEAWLVLNTGLMTPMGTGVVAVANEADARALAFDQADAVVMTYDEALAQLAAGELMIGTGMEMGGMDGMDQ